jgi:hypothetical protein
MQLAKGYDFDDTDPVKRVVTAAKLEQLVESATATFEASDLAQIKTLATAAADADKFGTDQLTDASVTTAKLADANVTEAKIADDAITTAKITDANVTTAKIADANITTAKIADANITTAKIADASVTAAKLDTAASGSIAGDIAGDGLVSANSKLNLQTGWQFLSSPYTAWQTGVVNDTTNDVKVADLTSGATTIVPNGVRKLLFSAYVHDGCTLALWEPDAGQSHQLGWRTVLYNSSSNNREVIFTADNVQHPISFYAYNSAGSTGGLESAGNTPDSKTHANLIAENYLRFQLNTDGSGRIVYLKILAYMW